MDHAKFYNAIKPEMKEIEDLVYGFVTTKFGNSQTATTVYAATTASIMSLVMYGHLIIKRKDKHVPHSNNK